jgi:hypothetical protein
MDKHDIIAFSSEGSKTLGVVILHCSNPLDDFYIVYADYALHKSHKPDEDAVLIMDNVIIPACDAAIAEYRLKRQHLRDMDKCHRDIEALIGAINSDMETDGLFEDKL